jgi:hypothetical protein
MKKQEEVKSYMVISAIACSDPNAIDNHSGNVQQIK